MADPADKPGLQLDLSAHHQGELVIRSMLEQDISIRAGKFESDRLSLEVRWLKDVPNSDGGSGGSNQPASGMQGSDGADKFKLQM